MKKLFDFLRNTLYRLANATRRFMVGRYGVDELYRFLLYVIFGLIILQYVFHSKFLFIIELVLIAVSLLRALSRDIVARQIENRKFILLRNKVASFFRVLYARITTSKTYRYRKCPHCGQQLRLPNRKGTHTVNCPNCHRDFDVKIR